MIIHGSSLADPVHLGTDDPVTPRAALGKLAVETRVNVFEC